MSRLGVFAAVLLLACVPARADDFMPTVTVGNPGNWFHYGGTGGGVNYVYRIGTFEVTSGQYAQFLNAVAATDTYGLYNTMMVTSPFGCQITRSGNDGNYTYDFSGRPSGTEADWLDRPVNWVSWGDAARFANWMHNGRPSGAQDLTTTEDGSYYIDGASSSDELFAVIRKSAATWVIPTGNEWYKAAYHYNDGVTGNYYDYPTRSNCLPSNDLDGAGNNATFWRAVYNGPGIRDYEGGSTIWDPYFRTEVGAHVNSAGPYGTFDMAGNVSEWTDVPILEYGPQLRYHRGGGFTPSGFVREELRAVNPVPAGTNFEFSTIGFRLARIPSIDRDGDGDVDLRDYALLQAAFTGPEGEVVLDEFLRFHANFVGPS